MYINEVFGGRVNILRAHVINDVLHEPKVRKVSVNDLWIEKRQAELSSVVILAE